jgi:hypothetical protein
MGAYAPATGKNILKCQKKPYILWITKMNTADRNPDFIKHEVRRFTYQPWENP